MVTSPSELCKADALMDSSGSALADCVAFAKPRSSVAVLVFMSLDCLSTVEFRFFLDLFLDFVIKFRLPGRNTLVLKNFVKVLGNGGLQGA